MEPMNELKPGKLSRPMDRTVMSNDTAVLKNLLGLLNNPAVTGAQQPAGDVLDAAPPGLTSSAPVITSPPVPVSRDPQPTPMSPGAFKLPAGCRSIFFTGAPKVGKSYLAGLAGARILELVDPVDTIIRIVFPDARPESIEALRMEIFAWGEGRVSQNYPLTAARLQFVHWSRGLPNINQHDPFGVPAHSFGTSDFWIRSLIAREQDFHQASPKELVVVTDVNSPEEYKALRAAGFAHVHVTCNNVTRSGRGGSSVVVPLVSAIERDLTQRLSQEPRGRKLWVVWCDEKYAPTSPRLLTVNEFIPGLN